jgi:hypothetical protein
MLRFVLLTATFAAAAPALAGDPLIVLHGAFWNAAVINQPGLLHAFIEPFLGNETPKRFFE